jgi:HrpA-like RNA helicase
MAQEQDLFPHHNTDLLPLYGSLPHHLQLKVFTKTDPKKRVIIFATSIAETSIT